MIVTQISVDLSGENRNEYVVAKQKDEDRVLQVQLLDNGRVYVLDDKTTARVFLVKPDHTEVNHDCTISNNRVEIELDANMLAMSGTATAEIVLTGEGGKPLTSAEFDIKIKGTLSTDRAESSEDFQSLKNALGKADKFESDLELKATKEELDVERRRIEKIIAPGKQVDGLATKRLTEKITSTSKSADDGNTFSVSWKSTDGGSSATFLNGIADKNPCVLDCYVYGMSKQAGTWENTSHRATAEITINGDTVSVSASYTTRDPDMNQAKFGVLLGYEEENREIADIRNGSDGKEYASAGEAVREQTKEVHKMSKALKTSKVDATAFSLGAVNVSTGEIEASATEAVSIGITRFNGATVGCKNSNNGYQIKNTVYYRASGKIADKNESWSNPGTTMKFTNENDTIFDRISIKRQDGGKITLADLPEEIYTNIPELREYLNGKEVETELQDIETELQENKTSLTKAENCLKSPYVDMDLFEFGTITKDTGAEVTTNKKEIRSKKFRYDKDFHVTVPDGYVLASAGYEVLNGKETYRSELWNEYYKGQNGFGKSSTEVARRLLIKRSDGANINIDDLRGKIETDLEVLQAMDAIKNLQEKVENAQTETDNTLTEEGTAADAKAVGDQIKQVKEDLVNTTALIANSYENLAYDYEIDDDTQSRQFIDFVPGNNMKQLYTDLSKKYFTLEAGKTYTLIASATVSGGINGIVALYLQTIASGNIIDGSVRLLVYSDGTYVLSSAFTATTSGVSSFRILANNTQQTGRVVFDSIAILEGEVTLRDDDIIKNQNTKNYFSYDLPDYLYQEQLNNHETRIKALETIVMNDICDLIGDSLTGGAYGAGVIYKYENHLKKLLPNWTMNNYGAGSEKANAISARSGGLEFYINPCTLTTTPTKVEFVDGQYRDFFLTTSTDFYKYYLDDGTKILLTRKTVGGSIVNYAALISGTKTIKRPTRVYDDFILNDNTSHVAIICIGANGGINSEIDLVAQVKNIIHENGYTRYLVLPENMSDIGQKRDPLLRQNRYLNEEFGKHFVNTYDYMIKYGLSDFSITPTDADNTDISLSIIPESLRCDSIHPNEKGCEITANLLYQRGKELGYW